MIAHIHLDIRQTDYYSSPFRSSEGGVPLRCQSDADCNRKLLYQQVPRILVGFELFCEAEQFVYVIDIEDCYKNIASLQQIYTWKYTSYLL